MHEDLLRWAFATRRGPGRSVTEQAAESRTYAAATIAGTWVCAQEGPGERGGKGARSGREARERRLIRRGRRGGPRPSTSVTAHGADQLRRARRPSKPSRTRA